MLVDRGGKRPALSKLGTPDDELRYVRKLRRAMLISELLCGLPDFVETAQHCDDIIAKYQVKARERGDRTKLDGGIMVEEFARTMFNLLVDHLKQNGLSTGDARERALKELPKHFGIGRARFEYWIGGRAAAQRRKPKDQRAHAMREKKKLFSKTDLTTL